MKFLLLPIGFIAGCVVTIFLYQSDTPTVIQASPNEYSIKMDESCYDQIVNGDGKVHIFIHNDLKGK